MDIEQLKQITGMNDAELSSYILDRYNNGATDEEIWNELAVGKLKDTNPKLSNKLIQERKDRLARNGWDEPWETYFTKTSFPNWRTHTDPVGNSTVNDNGWTDLKKAFTPNKAIDPLWQLGVIEDAFGDDSKFKMWNQNVEARKQRDAQYEYNKMLKEMDEAQNKKEKAQSEAKAKKEDESKNLDIFLGTLDKIGTKDTLTEPEKLILNVQYGRLGDKDKASYKGIYDRLSKPTEDNTHEDTTPTSTANGAQGIKYSTDIEQSKLKTNVANMKSKIAAMPNSTDKQKAAEELNKYIESNNKSVEGGLGALYSDKEIKSFGPKKSVEQLIKEKLKTRTEENDKFMNKYGYTWSKKEKQYIKVGN